MIRLVILLVWLLIAPLPLSSVLLARLAADTMTTETNLHVLLEPGRHSMEIEVDGRERKFVFITPTNFKPGQPLPLIFFLHGAGGTATQASRTYGWAEKAHKENFFAIFPEGLPARPDEEGSFVLNPHIWRDGREGLPVNGVNDVHFFEVLLGQLQSTLPIDPHRIYVTGFSNGAGMTFTLGSLFSNRIAAIAPVSSTSYADVKSLARPLPVYYLVGTADPLVLFNGGTSKTPWGKTHTQPPVQNSVDEWAQQDGCPPAPQVISDSGGVRVMRYGSGHDNSEILFTVVDGNGHHWPGTAEPLPKMISGPSLDPFNATDRIWDFFKAHPMP